jgi:hypothetical protein
LLREEYEMFMIVVGGVLETFRPCRAPLRTITFARTSDRQTSEGVRFTGGAGDAGGLVAGGEEGVPLGPGFGEGEGGGLGATTVPPVERSYSCCAHATTVVEATSVASVCMFGADV